MVGPDRLRLVAQGAELRKTLPLLLLLLLLMLLLLSVVNVVGREAEGVGAMDESYLFCLCFISFW